MFYDPVTKRYGYGGTGLETQWWGPEDILSNTLSTAAPATPAPPGPLVPPTGEEQAQVQVQQATGALEGGAPPQDVMAPPVPQGPIPSQTAPVAPPAPLPTTGPVPTLPFQDPGAQYQTYDPYNSPGGGYKKGGIVQGPGRKGDPVMIMAHKGEYVVVEDSTDTFKGFLDAINSRDYTLGMVGLPPESKRLDSLIELSREFRENYALR